MRRLFAMGVAVVMSLILILSTGGNLLANINPCHYPKDSGHDSCSDNAKMPLPPYTPQVLFPTVKELFAYLNATGEKKEFTELTSSSQGIPSNAKIAIAGDVIWFAWEGNIKGINHIFLTVSFDAGLKFTPPVELTPSKTGNASNLQLATSGDGKDVFAIWQETNSTGKRSVFFSSSMDWGQNFRTYSLNSISNEEFLDPQLAVSNQTVWFTWIHDPCQLNSTGTNCPIYAGHSRHW